tara:strand:- start:2471 stop:3208 length:738 start_codon:yes stop_codon:yes gene_type:complete
MTKINVTHILNVFFDEISDQSGKMLENFRHNDRAFARALLANQTEVKAKDTLQAGVALKATPRSLEIHPFVFRQVCRNGIILGKSTQSHKLGQVGDSCQLSVGGKAGEVISSSEIEAWFRDAVQACCQTEAFNDATQKFHNSLHIPLPNQAGVGNALLVSLNYKNSAYAKKWHKKIMREYLNHDDPTLFRLVNAVTAVARDLHDPHRKWKLECFAGELAVTLSFSPIFKAASQKALPKERYTVQI